MDPRRFRTVAYWTYNGARIESRRMTFDSADRLLDELTAGGVGIASGGHIEEDIGGSIGWVYYA